MVSGYRPAPLRRRPPSSGDFLSAVTVRTGSEPGTQATDLDTPRWSRTNRRDRGCRCAARCWAIGAGGLVSCATGESRQCAFYSDYVSRLPHSRVVLRQHSLKTAYSAADKTDGSLAVLLACNMNLSMAFDVSGHSPKAYAFSPARRNESPGGFRQSILHRRHLRIPVSFASLNRPPKF